MVVRYPPHPIRQFRYQQQHNSLSPRLPSGKEPGIVSGTDFRLVADRKLPAKGAEKKL